MGVMQTTGINANIKATQEFIIDTAADAKDLPIGAYPGSAALCIETGDVYVLGTDGEWSVIGGGGSSSNDSDDDNDDDQDPLNSSNPNTVEYIDGSVSVSDVFQIAEQDRGLDLIELLSQVLGNDVTIMISMDVATVFNSEEPYIIKTYITSDSSNSEFQANGCWITHNDTYSFQAFDIGWDEYGNLMRMYMVDELQGYDLTDFAESIPTTLTIIHHPDPETIIAGEDASEK